MMEIQIHKEEFGAEIQCSGSFVLGLTPEQYELLEVQKLADGLPNFLVAYKEMRFTVSEETAKKLLRLGASLILYNLSAEEVDRVKALLGVI